MLGPDDMPLFIFIEEPLSAEPWIMFDSKLVFGVAIVACALKYLTESFYGVKSVDLWSIPPLLASEGG